MTHRWVHKNQQNLPNSIFLEKFLLQSMQMKHICKLDCFWNSSFTNSSSNPKSSFTNSIYSCINLMWIKKKKTEVHELVNSSTFDIYIFSLAGKHRGTCRQFFLKWNLRFPHSSSIWFFFFFFKCTSDESTVNRVWETRFCVGTRVPKTIQLTNMFHLHAMHQNFF